MLKNGRNTENGADHVRIWRAVLALVCVCFGSCAVSHEASSTSSPAANGQGKGGIGGVNVGPRPSKIGSADANETGIRPAALTLDFRTVTQRGKYAPTNAGVAWVADDSGKWVHTFEMWISGEAEYVFQKYIQAGGPNYEMILSATPGPSTPYVPPPPDVITSATYREHKLHTGDAWDLKDANGQEVPDGNYSIVIEVAEESPEPTNAYQFPFEKGGRAGVWMPPNTGYLADVQLSLR